MEAFNIASTYQSYEGDKITFAGALRLYFHGSGGRPCLSTRWNDETQERYKREYETLLLPRLPRHKPLEDYDDDDFLSVVEDLSNSYEESTVQHFRHLLWIVYRAGAEDGQYDDLLLWDKRGMDEEKLDTEGVGRLKLIPKSLSIDEEIRMIAWVKRQWEDTLHMDGRDIGIMLMFFLGLRNQEACGLSYGDLKVERNAEVSFPCLYITKSTVKGSSIVKASGKTRNAARIIPLFTWLYDFLVKRKEAVLQSIEKGETVLPDGCSSIDEMPIACKALDYSSRSSASDLTKRVKFLFSELGMISKDRDAGLLDTIFQQKLKEIDVTEAEATCYLLRRNVATHLYALGLSAGQIQFLIGHDIEDTADSRNFHSNADDLLAIFNVLRDHPYQQFFSDKLCPEQLISSSSPLRIRVVAQEPNDPIAVSFKRGRSLTTTESVVVLPEGLSRSADLKQLVASRYTRSYDKEKK